MPRKPANIRHKPLRVDSYQSTKPIIDQISDLLYIIDSGTATQTYLPKDVRQQATGIVMSLQDELLRLQRHIVESVSRDVQDTSSLQASHSSNVNVQSPPPDYTQGSFLAPFSDAQMQHPLISPDSSLNLCEVKDLSTSSHYTTVDQIDTTEFTLFAGTPPHNSTCIKMARISDCQMSDTVVSNDILSTPPSQVEMQILDTAGSSTTFPVSENMSFSTNLDITGNPFRLLFSTEPSSLHHNTSSVARENGSTPTNSQDLLVYPGHNVKTDILLELKNRIKLPTKDHLTILNISRLRNSGISLTLPSHLAAKKLKWLIESVNDDSLFKCYIPSPKRYNIVVYHAHTSSTHEILEALSYKFCLSPHEISHIRDIKLHNGGRHAIIGLPMNYKRRVGLSGSFSSNWHLFQYKAYIALNRCAKCQSFAHPTTTCPEINFFCAYCGQNHKSKDCNSLSHQDRFCINCYDNHQLFPDNPIFDHHHTAASLQCPSMKLWIDSRAAHQ